MLESILSSNFNFKISFGDTFKKFYRKMLNRYCVPLSDFKVCMYWCAGHFKIYISKYWQIHKYGCTSSSSKKEYWFVSKGQINNGNKHKSCTFFFWFRSTGKNMTAYLFNMINYFLYKAALKSVRAVIRHRLMVSLNSENQGEILFSIIALDWNLIIKSGIRTPLLGI